MPAPSPESQIKTRSPSRTSRECCLTFHNSMHSARRERSIAYFAGLAWKIQVLLESILRSPYLAVALRSPLLSPLVVRTAVCPDKSWIRGPNIETIEVGNSILVDSTAIEHVLLAADL